MTELTVIPRMKIKALSPWFGSKRTLAQAIIEELGVHRAYFEPFCGSMAVLLAKAPAAMETVNDLHGDLVNLARVVQHPKLGQRLYRRCRRLLMVETLFKEAARRWKVRGIPPADTPDIERAIDFFYTSWVGRNGVVGTKSYDQGFAARYTPGGGHGGTRWRQAVSSIPAWRRRLASVTILNRCGFKLLDAISDEDGVVVYVDPPYVVKGARYVFDDNIKPACVSEDEWIAALEFANQHTFDIPIERVAWHYVLAQRVKRFQKARVVVSYYEHPLVRLLYPQFVVRKCPVVKALVQGNGHVKGAVEAPEILLLNGPSYANGTDFGLFQ